MRKNHSTISRRDFMKALGLGAATLGAAGAATTVFHDVDEITASTKSIQKLPWYVKERDYKNPTVPIDWTVLPRLATGTEGVVSVPRPPAPTPQERYDMGVPGGSEGPSATVEQAKTLFEHHKKEFPGWDPGYLGMGDRRTTALFQSSKYMRMGRWPGEVQINDRRVNVSQIISNANGPSNYTGGFLGVRSGSTLRPQEFNYPRWEGTPEENLRTMRSVVRFYGGSDVGVTELDSDTIKLLHKRSGNAEIVIEDVDDAYANSAKQVIPSKCKYVLQWTSRQPFEPTRRQCGEYEDAAVMNSYQRFPFVTTLIMEFIWALGYIAVSPPYHAAAFGPITGLGEHCRMSQPVMTPRYGTTNRAMWIMVTDLPLALTKPIDFGGYRFCKTCGICADTCPFGLVQKGEPTWEPKPDNGLRSGFLGYRTDSRTCPHCPVCQGTCPFNSNGDGSFVHDLVRNTSSLTSLFNGFFSNMEEFMGYGRKDPRDWWDMDDYTYGINTKY